MNQNPQPLVINKRVVVQAGLTTDFVDIFSGMGPYEQMNIFAVACRIEDGDFNMGDINNDGQDEITWTDILEQHIPSRPEDKQALPLCCNPRPGMGESLDLFLFRDKRSIFRGDNYIPLNIVNNNNGRLDLGCEDCPQHTGLILIFKEPIALYPSERLKLKIRNNNPIDEDDLSTRTYSMVTISFITEIVNKRIAMTMLTNPEKAAEEGMS